MSVVSFMSDRYSFARHDDPVKWGRVVSLLMQKAQDPGVSEASRREAGERLEAMQRTGRCSFNTLNAASSEIKTCRICGKKALVQAKLFGYCHEHREHAQRVMVATMRVTDRWVGLRTVQGKRDARQYNKKEKTA